MNSLREKLKILDCPYYDDDDENWPNNTLFAPSDARMNILVWLVSRFDTKFRDVLDGSTIRIGNRLDTKLQRLLMLCSMIGVCRTDNIELIQGTCSRKHQVAFWKNLIDLMLVNDRFMTTDSNAVSKHSSMSPHHCQGYTSSCHYIDKLSRNNTFSTMFSSHIQLFPPDIEKYIFPNGKHSQNSRITLPDLQKLDDTANKLAVDIEECEANLKDILSKEPKHVDVDQAIIDSKCKQMDLTLTMLCQTIETYLHHHDSEIVQWCSRPQPQLSGIGSVVDTLQRKLQDHTTFFGDANTIRINSQNISNRSATLSSDEIISVDETQSLATLKSYVGTLTDTMERLEKTRRHK